jgi:hypothetical protein
MNVTEVKKKQTLAKYKYCKHKERFCNKEYPCSTCIRLKANCSYIDQEELLTRSYKVDSAPILANQKRNLLNNRDSSNNKCLQYAVECLNYSGS